MNAIASALTALAGFVGDEITKELARRKLKDSDRELCGGKVKLMLRENRGFAMNRFESNRKLVVGISAAVFALLLVFYVPVIADDGYRTLRPGFSLMLAGAAGNVYDRLVKGRVTDFINISPLKKIVFNLADVMIVVGGLLTLIGDLGVE